MFHLQVKRVLEGIGAVQARADECLFIINDGSSYVKILAHVDDFMVTYNDRDLYDKVFAHMLDNFTITDFNGVRKFLGINIERLADGTFRIHQKPYIRDLLGRLGVKTVAESPEAPGSTAKLEPTETLTPHDQEFMDGVPYREAVGALFYLARATRFDISHACSQVARFMANPSPTHWKAVLRIYAYLNRTEDKALRIAAKGLDCEVSHFLDGLADADWAGCSATRRSHTGWMVRVGGVLVAWCSRRQTSVAQSTTEAEYIAAASLANEVVWWRRLCEDLGYGGRGWVALYCDNRSASVLADHEGRFDGVKHIAIKHHILREYQHRGLIKVVWRPGSRMLADIFTKNCSVGHFKRLVSEIMGEEV